MIHELNDFPWVYNTSDMPVEDDNSDNVRKADAWIEAGMPDMPEGFRKWEPNNWHESDCVRKLREQLKLRKPHIIVISDDSRAICAYADALARMRQNWDKQDESDMSVDWDKVPTAGNVYVSGNSGETDITDELLELLEGDPWYGTDETGTAHNWAEPGNSDSSDSSDNVGEAVIEGNWDSSDELLFFVRPVAFREFRGDWHNDPMHNQLP